MQELRSSVGGSEAAEQELGKTKTDSAIELAPRASRKVLFGVHQEINNKAPFSEGPISTEAHPSKILNLAETQRDAFAEKDGSVTASHASRYAKAEASTKPLHKNTATLDDKPATKRTESSNVFVSDMKRRTGPHHPFSKNPTSTTIKNPDAPFSSLPSEDMERKTNPPSASIFPASKTLQGHGTTPASYDSKPPSPELSSPCCMPDTPLPLNLVLR